MVRRLLLYSMLLAAIAAFFVLRHGARRAASAVETAAPSGGGMLVLENGRGLARLGPDTRFLDAIGAIAHAITGEAPGRATARFESGGWTLDWHGREVGHVSEFPRWNEWRGVLEGWAGALGAPESLAVADVDVDPGTAASRDRAHRAIEGALGVLHAVHAADLADRAWSAGHRDAATARPGARALTWMAAECFDEAGAGEIVASRALAWSAIVRAADPKALARENALLGDVLGYPADAFDAANALPQEDPIRFAVRWNDEDLDAIASRGGTPGVSLATREARWLALRRAVQRHDPEGWAVAADRGLATDGMLALPVLASQMAIARFGSRAPAGGALLTAVGTDLRLNDVAPAPIAAPESRTMADDMELFETLLETMPESADGAFLDRDVLKGWYRGAYYSSVMGLGDRLRGQRSSWSEAREFARDLGDGSRGPAPAAEFQRWFTHLVDPRHDAKWQGAVKQDLSDMPHFGAGPALRSWDVIRSAATRSDPFVRQCAPVLQNRLDTRPADLAAWGRIARGDLLDLVNGETTLDAATDASHPRDLAQRGWWAAYRGDRAALGNLLGDRRFSPEERTALIEQLRIMTPEDSVRLDALSERLVAERDDDWGIIGPYVHALSARHRAERVSSLAGEWLSRPNRTARLFDDVDARNQLAAACLDQGRIEDAYRVLQPVVGSWQETSMTLAAELLDRRGDGAEAETTAMFAWQRYPDSGAAQALVVDLFWRHHAYDFAATTLQSAPAPLSPAEWRSRLGPRFARLQRERPKDAARAVDALIARGFGDWTRMGGLVLALLDAGRAAEAKDLAAKLAGGGRLDPETTILAYRCVREALGDAAATEWLRSHLPASDDETLALLNYHAYGQQAGEAQWVIPLPRGPASTVEDLWLLRAAALKRDGVGGAERQAALSAHFATAGEDRSRRFGRMLLGLESESEVLSMRLDTREQCEADYYVGLLHQARGEFRDAAEWYSRCLRLNVWRSAEYLWATQQLARWVERDRSLERLEAESEAGRGNPPPAI